MKKLITLATFIFLSNGVFAEIPTNKEDLLKTTLTELNKTDPTTYLNKSSYQLEETTDTTGNFVITKYWNNNGTITPVNYNVKFDDVLGDGAYNYGYNWQIVDGNRTLVRANAPSDVVVNAGGLFDVRIDTDQQGANVLHGFALHSTEKYGGAIYNYNGSIGSIKGDFVLNRVSSSSGSVYGGAICNRGYGSTSLISSITGNFINNYVSCTDASATAYGGAIYNVLGSIGLIIGDFIGNYATSNSDSYGGAIYYNSRRIIDSITGDFIGNYVTADGDSYGGAIYKQTGSIGSITGDFIGNYATSNGHSYGGAIYNAGTIGSITGDFIGNYATSGYSYGGAIYNDGTISSITGDFLGNYASDYGGAIYNAGTIDSITGDFIGNYVYQQTTVYLSSSGGAIYNKGRIGSITGDFIGNYSSGDGGAIYSYGTISSITGDFIGNSSGSGGAIYNDGTISSITGDFIGNYSSGSGGAIYNNYNDDGTISSITGDFIGNYSSDYGGAIYNSRGVTIDSITGDFIGNYSSGSGGAIYNDGGITIREGSSFTGNYITTDGGVTKTFEAIYNTSITINFNVYDTSKSIIVNDGINGETSYKTFQILNINQVSDAGVYGTVEFNSFVNNQTVNVLNGILKLGSFAGATLDVNGTELIVPETRASLTNTNINVSSGAKVIIDTAVSVAGDSRIFLKAGAILAINSGSSLSVDSESYFDLKGAKLEINLGSIIGDFELNLIQVNDATALADLLATLKSEDTTSVFSNEQKVYGWTLYQGTGDYASWIVLAGTVAVPEPAEWAVILGTLALGFVAYRKRK